MKLHCKLTCVRVKKGLRGPLQSTGRSEINKKVFLGDT